MIVGNDVLNKTNAIISYEEQTVIIFDNVIPYVGITGSQSTSVNNQCLIADFIYVSKSDKKKLRRTKKPCEKSVTEIAEYASNCRVDKLIVHDQVIIPVVSKMKAKTNTCKKQGAQKQNVHVLSDITVPASRCMTVLAYAKLSPADYIVSKTRMTNGLFIAEGLITIKDEASRTFPLFIMNVNDCDVNLTEGTVLSTAERIEVVESHVICEDFGKEIRNNVSKFLKQDVSQGDTLINDTVLKSTCTDEQIKKSTSSLQACVQKHQNDRIVQNKSLQNGEKEVSSKTSVTCKQNELLRLHKQISEYQMILLQYIKSLDTSGENIASGSTSKVFTEKALCLNCKTDEVSHSGRKGKNNNADCITTHTPSGDKINSINSLELKSSNKCSCDYSDIPSQNTYITKNDRQGDIELNEVDMNKDLPMEFKLKLKDLLNEFRLVCAKKDERIGVTNKMSYKIELKTPDLVINIPPYRIPHKYQSLLHTELSKLKDQGIISESISSFNAPVLCVRKPNDEIRVVIDYRALNKHIEIHTFALPNINEILHSLGGAKVFSTLDLKSAFHQIRLDPETKHYTAFSVGNEKFEYSCLPFGMATSPSVYQCLMSRVLQSLLGSAVFCYIDDIVVFSENYTEHMIHLRQVFEKLSQAHLSLKLEKCSFLKSEVKYLGYKINKDGISCENSFKLLNCQQPTDVKSLQRFLGMVNYFRKFVPLFSTIANPLYKLLRTDTPFNWTNECENAFIKLKTILDETTTLAHPDYNKEFILFSDASNFGLSGCLAQADENGTLKPLSYFSKTLLKTQQRYSTTKREGLALVSCLKHFQFILLGYPTIVCTDHRPLISLFSKKTSN